MPLNAELVTVREALSLAIAASFSGRYQNSVHALPIRPKNTAVSMHANGLRQSCSASPWNGSQAWNAGMQ